MVKEQNLNEKSCCTINNFKSVFRCLACGFYTCTQHGVIWEDDKIHCVRCFNSLQVTPGSIKTLTTNIRSESFYRCLLIIDGLYIAGAQKSVLSLIYALKECGVGVHILSLFGGGQWFNKFMSICEVITICYNGNIDWYELKSVNGFKTPNIISAHLCASSAWVLEHAPAEIPLISHLHSEFSEHENLTFGQVNLLINRAKRIIVPSPATLRYYNNWVLKNLPQVNMENIITVPNIIIGAKKNCKRGLILKDKKTILFSPTRLDYDKLDIDILLQFIIELSGINHSYHLVIAGDGEYKNYIQSFINCNSLSGYVSILGFQPEIEEYYHACEVVILFSKREAMPMVLVESVIYNRPLVAPRIGVFEDLTKELGIFLYELGDLNGLIMSLENAINFKKHNNKVYSDGFSNQLIGFEKYISIIQEEYQVGEY